MKTSEFAKMIHVSSQTLRNYEKRGILVPIKLPTGYRIYTEKHIEEAKKLGLVEGDK